MRIVSLLPSATEILFALGLDEQIVGVSHECDTPAQARTKPVVIRSRIPPDCPSGEIDRLVWEFVSRGESLYSVDAEALEELAPDLIITQDLCHVCAASPEDLSAALARFAKPPKVLCLNPLDLGEVWRDILRVGEETATAERARCLVAELEARMSATEMEVRRAPRRPRVALLEWLDPFYVGGHWVPEMIARAGGDDLFGRPRTPSFRITPEQVIREAPEFLLIAPCGYSASQARDEYLQTAFPLGWEAIPAVREGQVFALEASGYFSRPGPRLVEGFEALAQLFHRAGSTGESFSSIVLPVGAEWRSARAASG
ncbi:MAG TPA: cobalamin-binding protein [Candidatus Acidoferrales bacterium]|nr:cobalamin-binding protein [Candidatus Acidoferrales bacterium]